MGGKYSILSQPKSIRELETDNGDAYFALALLEPNRICLVHAGADVIGILQRSLRGDKSSASQSQNDDFVHKECRKEDGSYEFELRGKPFSRFAGRTAALRIKRLLCQLVADLYMHGWDLCVASDLTTDDYHTTWFFRQATDRHDKNNQGGARIRSKRRIVSLSLSGSDSLTLINAPERLRKALIDAVRFGYTYGSESEDMFDEDLEIKLNGGPWETNMLEEGIWARKLLLEIFRQFAKCKYAYYAVADTKGTADSIFFIHQQPDTIPVTRSPEMIKTTVTKDLSPSGSTKERRGSSCCVNDDRKLIPGSNSSSKDQLTVLVPQQPRRSSWQELRAQSASVSAVSPEPYPIQIEQFFMVSLNRTDSLRLIDAPKTTRDLIKNLITLYWPYGLQRENKYEMAYEFRLNRSPWAASGGDAVAAHSFLTLLFESMLGDGWNLLATIDMSRRKNDKSVFIMRKDASIKSISSRHHFCLSMTDGDKIRIIRGDDQVIALIRQVVKEHWPYGIQKEREFFGSYELQLVGHPWLNLPGNCNEPLSARVMLLELLRQFHEHQWRVIVSADISGRYQTPANLLYNPVSVDSWIVATEREDENVHVSISDVEIKREKNNADIDLVNGNERDKR